MTIDELEDAINKEILVLETGSDSLGDHKHSAVTSSFHTGTQKGPPADNKVLSMCVL